MLHTPCFALSSIPHGFPQDQKNRIFTFYPLSRSTKGTFIGTLIVSTFCQTCLVCLRLLSHTGAVTQLCFQMGFSPGFSRTLLSYSSPSWSKHSWRGPSWSQMDYLKGSFKVRSHRMLNCSSGPSACSSMRPLWAASLSASIITQMPCDRFCVCFYHMTYWSGNFE